MTDRQKRNEIYDLLTFLQRHIEIYVKNSFTDLTFDLERVILDFLNVFEESNDKFINVNSIRHNYPAVDLVSKTKNIAIQITTNADKKKIDKTIMVYEKHKLAYDQLIIIGFVKATNPKISSVSVYGVDFLTERVKFGNTRQLDEVYEILKGQIPLNILSPLSDKNCFDVIFDVINRSAVRDYTECEGDFDKMADGLFEAKEIITTGKIKEKNIRAKALVEFNGHVKRRLQEIELYISQILQICNLNKNIRQSNFLCLSKQETDEIDELKTKIIASANSLSNDLGLNKNIIVSSRR